jgi:hypothetical protein
MAIREIQNKVSYFFLLATEKNTFLRAIRVSLIVGVILNLINHPQILKDFSFSGLSIVQLTLTFFVPFAVSVYSSVMSEKSRDTGKTSNSSAL